MVSPFIDDIGPQCATGRTKSYSPRLPSLKLGDMLWTSSDLVKREKRRLRDSNLRWLNVDLVWSAMSAIYLGVERSLGWRFLIE